MVTSRSSAMPEMAGDAALLLDPLKFVQLARRSTVWLATRLAGGPDRLWAARVCALHLGFRGCANLGNLRKVIGASL